MKTNKRDYLQQILTIAKNFRNAYSFRQVHQSCYSWCERNGFLKQLKEACTPLPPKYNKENLIKVASLCKTKKDFREKYHKEYIAANRLGILKEITSNLENTVIIPKPGDIFKEFKVIKKSDKIAENRPWWDVECSCGTKKALTTPQLKHKNHYKDCGHSSKRNQFKAGQTYNWWTVLDAKVDKNRKILLKCKCGTERKVNIYSIGLKNHISCGCYNREILNKQNHLEPGESAFNDLFDKYLRAAKSRNHTFELLKSEFRKLTKKKCFYCGTKPEQVATKKHKSGNKSVYVYNGIDRVNNDKGYFVKNCVSCCKKM